MRRGEQEKAQRKCFFFSFFLLLCALHLYIFISDSQSSDEGDFSALQLHHQQSRREKGYNVQNKVFVDMMVRQLQ